MSKMQGTIIMGAIAAIIALVLMDKLGIIEA